MKCPVCEMEHINSRAGGYYAGACGTEWFDFFDEGVKVHLEATIACKEIARLRKGYAANAWTNGRYSISWQDLDTIVIDCPDGREAKMHGGDFEYILSALTAAYWMGCRS